MDTTKTMAGPGIKAPDNKEILEFKNTLRGDLIGQADPAYNEARKVYNAMIDKRPLLIAECADTADVILSVNFARKHDMLVAVRGGSHNVAGFSVCDGGIVIDLSKMKGIHVDPERKTARVEGGATWGDLDHATHAFGLAAPGGIISTTGIGGLTLGGGIGHLTRKHGLSCDNLISADMVTADGRLLKVNKDQNADLFWAMRGGGGNFGIVTSFEFRLHPVSTVYGGPIFWDLDKSTEAMRFYRDYMKKAPEDMNAFFAFLIVPPGPPFPEHLHNKKVCGVVCCHTGPLDQAEKDVQPLREFGKPLLENVGPMPYPALNSAFDGLVPKGLQHYWKADFVNELSDEVIAAHVKYGPDIPTFNSALHIYPVSGAAQKIGKDETAYSYRDAEYVHVIAAMYPDPKDTPKNKEWVKQYWNALHPHSSGGAYVNFMMEEGDERIQATYRGNYDRLAKIKNKYDPGNLFRMNQNIHPKV